EYDFKPYFLLAQLRHCHSDRSGPNLHILTPSIVLPAEAAPLRVPTSNVVIPTGAARLCSFAPHSGASGRVAEESWHTPALTESRHSELSFRSETFLFHLSLVLDHSFTAPGPSIPAPRLGNL